MKASGDCLVPAKFRSVWEGGVSVETNCHVNLKTKRIFNIETSDVSEGIGQLESEHAIIDGHEYPAVPQGEAEADGFWY